MAPQESSRPATLFYSYAHEDEALRGQLERHLRLLERQGMLQPWHDRQIEAGEEWRHTISEHLETASIILLLISPDFLASDYCYDIEMRLALERQQAGEARVIPLILRPCDWQTAPFGHLQALPRNGQAITSWPNQDEAFLQVSHSLRALLTKQPLSAGKNARNAMQNRANMLVKLQRLYDEALDDSLQKLAWIDLPLTSMPGAVHTTANLLLRRTNLPPQPLAPGTTVQQVYQQANQELLILGDPGAGKSTLVYQLGRDLLTQAQQQPSHPLPIVIPLASWSKKRFPLQEWLVEQLCSALYEVPHQQSKEWVQNQQILPLLDGLDEVEESARSACIAAINAYRSAFPWSPLVVCSRSQEYHVASQQERLHLYSAVEVQPLTWKQQEEALQQAGKTAEGLRTELTNNEELRKLTRTPLWLNIFLLTFRESSLSPLPQKHAALQQEVLRRYIQRMCERKGDATRYPLESTLHWLGFLAKQMRQRNQVVFAVEELQPDWLTKRFCLIYRWSVGLIGGLGVGLVSGLGVGLLLGRFGRLGIEPLFGLVAGLIAGLVFGLLFGLESKITLAEHFVWSWERLRLGLLFGLLFGPIAGLVTGLIFGPFFGLLFGLGIGLGVGVGVGLQGKQVVERDTSSPGKGAYHSMRNGLLVWLGIGLVGGLSVVLNNGLFFGLFFGLAGIGLFGGQDSGPGTTLQHFMIRFWLARADCLPWQTIAFLNDTCERALLKCVGGTYRFIHRLVLDYFADLEQHNAHPLINLPTVQAVEFPVQHQATSDIP